MHNKHLRRTTMSKAENLDGLAPEQYGICKSKAEYIQALNIRLFYYLIRPNITPATRIFVDLVSNCDMVVHSIASMPLQRVYVPK